MAFLYIIVPIMCGRYGLYRCQERLIEHLGLASVPSLKARYNIAPGDAVGIVRITSGFDGPESKKKINRPQRAAYHRR